MQLQFENNDDDDDKKLWGEWKTCKSYFFGQMCCGIIINIISYIKWFKT